MSVRSLISLFIIVGLSFGSLGCAKDKPSDDLKANSDGDTVQNTSKIHVTWADSKEVGVHQAGGGYRVYVSPSKSTPLSESKVTDVPYVEGERAPHEIVIAGLAAGKHYVRIVAYTALASKTDASGSQSRASAAIVINVPELK